MWAIRSVAGLLASLAGVGCVTRTCDLSLRLNPLTVHESDITLSRPATTVDARFCLDAACRSTSLDTRNFAQQSCIRLDGFGSQSFCLMPLATDTLHIGALLSTAEAPSPPSFVQLTITDPESGDTLFDKKSRVSVHDFDDDGCHTTWSAEATL